MENNDKQLIDQALSFVNENNRFAMKTITKNSVSRSNFYKLSIDLPVEIRKDDDDSKTPVEPSTKPYTPVIDFKGLVDDENPEGKSKDESEEKSEDKSKDEPKDKSKDKFRKERKKTFYQRLKEWTEKKQAKAIMDLYGIDVSGMKPEEIADILETRYSPGPSFPKSNILNTNLGKDR
jgi:hypothetical protein